MNIPGFNIQAHLHKRWCRFIIQRYLGQFLDRNLELEQLSIAFSSGTFEINDVYLHAPNVNELLTQMNFPLKLIDGFVKGIKIEVPWKNLMGEPSKLVFDELQLTFQANETVKLDEKDLAPMIGSMVASFMSSGELAKSIVAEDEEFEDDEDGQNGVQALTRIIDAILSRFCLELTNTTIRFENKPTPGSDFSTAVEMRIESVRFVDEQVRNCEQEMRTIDTITSQPQGIGSVTNLNKVLLVKGISMYTDVFTNMEMQLDSCSQVITSMYIRREKQKQKSGTISPNESVVNPDLFASSLSSITNYHSCYSQGTMDHSLFPTSSESVRNVKESADIQSCPVKFAEIHGESQVVFRLKNNEMFLTETDNKVEISALLKNITLFIGPSQVEIVKRFFSAIAMPEAKDVSKEHGERMRQEDYDEIVKRLEDVPISSTVGGGGIGSRGNWQKPEIYSEFQPASPPDRKSSTEQFGTLKNDKRSTMLVHATFQNVIAFLPHYDVMSEENVAELANGGIEAIEQMIHEAEGFFTLAKQLTFNATTPLHTIRKMGDKIFTKDHIRFIGSNVSFTHELNKNASGDYFSSKLIVANCDCIEYLTKASNPTSPGDCHIPLLDFSEYENPNRDAHLKFVVSSSSNDSGKLNMQLYVGKAKTELDLSIVDRISDLLAPRPFYDRKMRPRMNSFAKREAMPLSDDLFEQNQPSTSKSSLRINSDEWRIDMRIPIADLRRVDNGRINFRHRNLHPQFLRINLKGVNVDVPLRDDVTTVVVSCEEITGDFMGFECSEDESRFLYGAKSAMHEHVKISFEYDLRNKSLRAAMPRTMSPMEDMSKSISMDVIRTLGRREGPFSQTHHSYEYQNDITQAGSREEMLDFGKKCIEQSMAAISIDIPIIRLLIPNHDYLEVLYNRLVNDLALWQPAAPALVENGDGPQLNDDQFQECRVSNFIPSSSAFEDDEVDEMPPTNGAARSLFDRSKSHVASVKLTCKKGNIWLGTKVNENEKVKGTGQVGLELVDAELFTVVGYYGDMNHCFFYFTTSKIALGNKNFSGRIPSNIMQKDFGRWQREDTQLEFVSVDDEFSAGSTADALAVAMHLNSDMAQNTKEIVLALSVRNTAMYLRPFRDPGHLWATQLAELFLLSDYDIQGYEMPRVSTELHVSIENAVAIYDHSWITPDSPMRLRLTIGHCNVSSTIVPDTDLSKFLCIFESVRLHLSNEKARSEGVRFEDAPQLPRERKRQFLTVADVGLFDLEISKAISSDQTKTRTHPGAEIKCRNLSISAWFCADSLVALTNTISEISQSEKYQPIPVETSDYVENEFCDETRLSDDIQSEAAGSTWSRTTSVRNAGTAMPPAVEQQLQKLVASAIKDRSTDLLSDGIECGIDAVNEFSLKQKVATAPSEPNSITNQRRYYSTDEEFCMVDDIVGSGVTNADGIPRIKHVGTKGKTDEVQIDPMHFQVPKIEGCYALANQPIPAFRFTVSDVSVSLHIFAGNDMSKDLSSRPYSMPEYREGKGKGQIVSPESRGGAWRDHSACVVFELKKLSLFHQVFDKDASWMTMSQFSIYDIIVHDRLWATNIKEMLYQFSTTEQPRRTCAPMLAVRMAQTKNCEGKMRVSMLPLKLNVDQDTLNFLEDFTTDVIASLELPTEVTSAVQNRPVLEVPATMLKETKPQTLYPHLSPGPSLASEPLTPSPVAAPQPLGDLSILENRGVPQSPVRHPISDAPLTESAVSLGDLFNTKSRQSNRSHSPLSNTSSPDLLPVSEVPEELDSELFDLQGDWKTTSEINFEDEMALPSLPVPERRSSIDDLLSRSTMEGSFHPDMFATDNNEPLIDTNDDQSTICDEDEATGMETSTRKYSTESQPPEMTRDHTFFKEFVFSPSATIYVDYQGKNRIDMKKGIVGFMTGVGHLTKTEIVLKEIIERKGLLGVGRCVNHVYNEWIDDIMKNIPKNIGSLSPISPIVQISRGFIDLFWLPVNEMKKDDGHIVKGIQKGVGSFGRESAAGLVGIVQTLFGAVQLAAETVLYEVQPDAPYLNRRNARALAVANRRPTDVRDGVQQAYDILSTGFRDVVDDMERVAQEDRSSGRSFVGTAFRNFTPFILRPLLLTSRAGYSLLGGVRNQLRPDMYKDDSHKFHEDNVPGCSN